MTRHFFRRMFLNDVTAFEEQVQQRVIAVMALLAVLSLQLSMGILAKYEFMPDRGTSWVEKCFLMSFFMVILGFIAVLQWESVFPDARDYANMTPLPVRIRTLFWAKFSSLFLFVGIFAVGINLLSTFAFMMVLPQAQSRGMLHAIWLGLVHLISNLVAGLFAFLLAALLVGIFMLALGPRLFERLSMLIRSGILVVYFLLILIFLRVAVWGDPFLNFIVKLKRTDSPEACLFPPYWFTGIYETLLGTQDTAFHGYARFGLIAMAFVIGAFYLVTGTAYRRLLKKMGTGSGKPVSWIGWREKLSSIVDAVILRNPTQRAVFHFYTNTLRRSTLHRMKLSNYAAVALGLILLQIMIHGFSRGEIITGKGALMSAPLILGFFLVLAIRNLVDIPAFLESNWIFQLTEFPDHRHYTSSLRKAVIFSNLLPLYLGLFMFYAIFWNAGAAAFHCFFAFVVSAVIMEVLFLKWIKIPFTCSYLAGKEKIQLYWVFYLIVFLVYMHLMMELESMLFRRPGYSLLFLGFLTVAALGARFYRQGILYKKRPILYEENPEPVLVSMR